MNINENIRNKRKNRNFKGVYVQITHMSAANYSKLPRLVSNER